MRDYQQQSLRGRPETQNQMSIWSCDNVIFRRAPAPVEVSVIGPDADWDDLSSEVIPRLVEQNLDFATPVRYS
jgi:hypothetical protein